MRFTLQSFVELVPFPCAFDEECCINWSREFGGHAKGEIFLIWDEGAKWLALRLRKKIH